MNDDDVRDMLRRKAASVHPSPDGLEKIESKLGAEPARARRAPMLAAAAILVIALLSIALVVAQRDDRTQVAAIPPATTTTMTTPAAPPGVWPWQTETVDQSALRDPVETAKAYVAARVGITTATTVSDFQQGDVSSGEVVFGGDVSTTVLVRRDYVHHSWYVVGAASDLVPIQTLVDGTHGYTIEADGDITSWSRSPDHEPLQATGGPVHPGGSVFNIADPPVDQPTAFAVLLETATTKAFSEVRLR